MKKFLKYTLITLVVLISAGYLYITLTPPASPLDTSNFNQDGKEISRSFSRHVVSCVDSNKNADDSWTHTDTDISGESTEVQAIANAVWTDAIKAAKKSANEASMA